jgi:hypothetical protein
MSSINLPFKPQSELSRSLLSSIPKKIFLWLENLQQDQTRPFTHGPFVYMNAGDHGLLSHIGGDEIIQIAWTGEAPNIETVCASDRRFEEIEFNLEWFTTVENRIYNEMERFEQEISAQDASFPKISKQQLIHQAKNEND